MPRNLIFLFGILTLLTFHAHAQQATDPVTLLPDATLRAMNQELSGSEALSHVLEITPYERNRPAEEYGTGTYREAAYMANKAHEVGLSEVVIERFPQAVSEWDAEMAELWIEQPVRKLITRYRDVTATLASGSMSADVRAELVFVGRGDSDADYENISVEGKLVLASGPVGAVHDLAVLKYGAAGVVSFYNGTGKPEDRPDQIAWGRLTSTSLAGEADEPAEGTTFGFVLSHRMGTELKELLRTSPEVTAHAKIKTARYPAEHQVVTATIPGDGSITAPHKSEVLFIAHLFEGIAKQGANDNASGPAVQLELARSWIKLIEEGVLPPPKRTIRFLWVPEFTGTNAYIERYPDFLGRLLGVINMDMVGASQSIHRHSLNVVTTPYSLPSFVNDLSIQFMEYVGDNNHSQVTNRQFGFGFRNPIFDPGGSRDPFWFHISRFSFGSDHQVFTEARPRVPSVAFNNFHDYSYHTSEDTPALLDPTQMKRMSFIGLAMGLVMANKEGDDALAVASLSATYGKRRLGHDLSAASMMLAQAAGSDVHLAYKEARNLVVWAYEREKAGVSSSSALIGPNTSAQQQLKLIESALGAGYEPDLQLLELVYQARCMALGLAALPLAGLNPEEQAAAKLIPRQILTQQDASDSKSSDKEPLLATYYATEARNYADGTRSILDIRNAISAEYGPVALIDVAAFFNDLVQQGSWAVESNE